MYNLGYTPDDMTWLKNEYTSVLGYPGDAAGLEYWAGEMDKWGRDAVHKSFLDVAGKATVVKNDSGGADVMTIPSASFLSGVSTPVLIGGGVAALGLLMLLEKKR